MKVYMKNDDPILGCGDRIDVLFGRPEEPEIADLPTSAKPDEIMSAPSRSDRARRTGAPRPFQVKK